MPTITTTFLLFLATTAMASTAREWVKYKLKHEKLYSEEEDTDRMKIWMKNVAMVEKHNSENHNYTMAINKFSDWTKEEFNKLLGVPPQGKRFEGKKIEIVKTPDRVDFREDKLVTPVKDQMCGDCWAYSTAGAIEGLWAKNKSELVSLSVQQLVDCAPGNCITGGHVYNAFKYVIEAGGIQSEKTYPEKGVDGSCHADSNMFVANIKDYKRVASDEDQIESTLYKIGHPITIYINACEALYKYEGGVFNDDSCNTGIINHAVLIVGYDRSGPQPFWIVKNSWGTDWGENGFVRMKMGVNCCLITDNPWYPTM